MSGSLPRLSEFERMCCNIPDNCNNKATIYCSNCQLVGYCSTDCEKKHESTHTKDCLHPVASDEWKPNYRKEGRRANMPGTSTYRSTPGLGGTTFLWGNTPAFDLINLAQNEGENYQKDLNLYFAASGDLRNVITAIANLPDTYKGQVSCVINDVDEDVCFKNLHLLTALVFEEDEIKAAEAVLHLWYSAKLSPDMVSTVKKAAGNPSFQSRYKEFGMSKAVMSNGRGYYKLRLVSTWKQDGDASFPNDQSPKKWSEAEANRKIAISGFEKPNKYTDPLQLNFELRLTPKQRIADMRFRETGVLQPFGAAVPDSYVLNPTLFDKECKWMPNAWKSPMTGWSLKSVLVSGAQHHVPTNDVYGSMYFHIRDLLIKFHRSIRKRPMDFFLTNCDAAKKPTQFSTTARPNLHPPVAMIPSSTGLRVQPPSAMYFDRIDSSNIADQCWLGIYGCLAMGGWLKHKSENEHATLLTCFMQAVRDFDTPLHNAPNDALKSRPELRDILMPKCINAAEAGDGDFIERQARFMFRDLDAIFDLYKDKHHFTEFAQRLGMEEKSKNTIIEKFPYRTLITDTAEEIEQKRFHESPGGPERYAEWKLPNEPTSSVLNSRGFF